MFYPGGFGLEATVSLTKLKLPFDRRTLRKHLPRMLSLNARKRSQTVLVLSINYDNYRLEVACSFLMLVICVARVGPILKMHKTCLLWPSPGYRVRSGCKVSW